ncbi:hypothetical protein CsSME_00049572 [Camellia sinensis var. sinensis]
MADSVVTFLLAKLSSLLAEELKVLGGVKGDLVVADAMERSDLVLQTWVKQVRDVAYDTDDVLEEFMLRLASYHHRGLNGTLEQGLSSHVANNAWYD